MGDVLRQYFPHMPCYERFVTLQKSVFMPLLCFLLSRLGHRTGIYYIDSTALPVCHNRRISRHQTFAGLAARGKTSMGWFFGFKLHLVFNHEHEIVALKLTPGNVSDTAPVISLVKGLTGKLFGVYLVQYGGGCFLDNFVLKRRHCKRALPSVGLRYVPTPGWSRPIRSPVDSGVPVHELALKVCLIVLPRLAVHAGSRISLEGEKRQPEQIDCNVVEKRGEPLLLPLPCGFPYASQRL
jgi:Transposase DDE domain